MLAHYEQLNVRLDQMELEHKDAVKSISFLHEQVADLKKQLAAPPSPKSTPIQENRPTSAEHLARQRSIEFSGLDFKDGEDLIKMTEQLPMSATRSEYIYNSLLWFFFEVSHTYYHTRLYTHSNKNNNNIHVSETY